MARPRLGESERRTRTVGVRVTAAEAVERLAGATRSLRLLTVVFSGQPGRRVALRNVYGGYCTTEREISVRRNGSQIHRDPQAFPRPPEKPRAHD